MVTAFLASSSATSTSTGNYRSNSENPPPHHDDSPKPHRSPLAPSVEKDNAAPKRPRSKDVSSRYLAPSPTTYSTATVTSSSGSSSSSPLFPSPTVAQRCSVPRALNRHSVEKRCQSVSRAKPLTARTDSQAENSAAAQVQYSQTRSLSVSFQGEPFFYKTSRPKNTSFVLLRKPSPERRLAGEVAVTPARDDHSENSRPLVKQPRRPGARARDSNPLMRSLDCSSSRSHPILVTVQLLRESMEFGDGSQRSSVDAADLSASSDNDSMSSEGNSGAPQFGMPLVEKVAPRGISVPARFLQETSSRQRRLQNLGLFLPPPSSSSTLQSEPGSMRKLSVTNPSPLRRPIRSPSLANYMATPSRGMDSPLSVRCGTNVIVSPSDQPVNAPSIISFAAEVRRSKKGESRIEEAHTLRLLDNRYFQWRFVNAKNTTTLLLKKVIAEVMCCHCPFLA